VRNTSLRTAYVHSYIFVCAYVRTYVRRRSTLYVHLTSSSYVRRTFACCRKSSHVLTSYVRMYFDVVICTSYVGSTSSYVVITLVRTLSYGVRWYVRRTYDVVRRRPSYVLTSYVRTLCIRRRTSSVVRSHVVDVRRRTYVISRRTYVPRTSSPSTS